MRVLQLSRRNNIAPKSNIRLHWLRLIKTLIASLNCYWICWLTVFCDLRNCHYITLNRKLLTLFVRTKPRGSVVITKPLANVAKQVAFITWFYIIKSCWLTFLVINYIPMKIHESHVPLQKQWLSLFFSESDHFISNKCMNCKMLQVDIHFWQQCVLALEEGHL